MKELWLPILVSALACLGITVLAWGVLPFHSREHRRLPTETDLLSALRRDLPAQGVYAFPYRGPRGALTGRADVAANLARGPVGFVVIGKPGAPRVALRLLQHFIFFATIAMVAAYIATISGLKDGAPFLKVFRVVSIVAAMPLMLGAAPLSIWISRPWKSWLLQCADGLACGLATGAVFAWLWPQ
jgi:hypothetical protein